MNPLRLVHLANVNSTNIGNGALILGTEDTLTADLPMAVRWSREAWDDYTFGVRAFDRAFVDLVNASDGLIVGGAVAINGRSYLANAGMRFDLPLELWPELRRPVVFYGLSYRHWPHQRFDNLDKLKRALDLALNNPRMLFSVRNDGTREWLADMCGTPPDLLPTVPDPALFTPHDADGVFPEIAAGKRNIILSFNNEDAVYRFGGAQRELMSAGLSQRMPEKDFLALMDKVGDHRERRRRTLQGIVYAVERIAREWDVRYILAPHYFDDYEMINEFISLCQPRVAHQTMVSTGLLGVDQTRYFYGRYARADLAVSMRVHSMSPSIGLGVPMVPVITQDRMWAFLKEGGLDDLGLDAFADDLGDRLYAAMTAALQQPEPLRQRYRAARERFRADSRRFHGRVAEVLAA